MPQMADPATDARAVTPSDTTVLECRALYVGGTGIVVVMPYPGGTAVSFVGVSAGTFMPVNCYQVMAATTATSIVALY